jgi:Amt family ammonium transporter
MNFAVSLICLLLVPFSFAGLALIQQGLGRSRSAAHAMLGGICALSVSAIAFVLIGSAWAGYPGGPNHSFFAGGIAWNWLGAAPRWGHAATDDGLYASLVLCLQLLSVALTAMIPVSTGNDRWRLRSICASSALLACGVFPLFAHWLWGGGWLSQLQNTLGLPPLLDVGGAGTIHVIGGLSALCVAWLLGPRRGKYDDGMAAAIPGHNIVLVLFGCVLALVGWTGLNMAASLLFHDALPQELLLVFLNALLCASAGCLAAVATTRLRYRKVDASLSANGWVAGLVAGSAACGQISPAAAIFTGLVAGALMTFVVEALELKLFVDDPAGSIAVHAVAGFWGLLACGFFARTHASHLAQLSSQMVGVATLLGVMLPLIYLTNALLNKIMPYRVDDDGDLQGMDIRELGAGAYPEFVLHADDLIPR